MEKTILEHVDKIVNRVKNYAEPSLGRPLNVDELNLIELGVLAQIQDQLANGFEILESTSNTIKELTIMILVVFNLGLLVWQLAKLWWII